MSKIELELSPEGEIRLILVEHHNRAIDVPATGVGAKFIVSLLKGAHRDASGFIRDFPTQWAAKRIDWSREPSVKRTILGDAETRKKKPKPSKKAFKSGKVKIDVSKLEFRL